MKKNSMASCKYIFISGGVLSGLGKGITTASLALLLRSRGFKVTPVKCDMYLNIDAGSMNPVEHGEVFVTADGMETDQDLGHYERFLGEDLSRENYITTGQIYWEVLKKERELGFEGKCVQAYYHIPQQIIKRINRAAKTHKAEIVLVELGGTVGEYQNAMFYEAIRRLKLRGPQDVALVLVGYMPVPPSIGELKSKPLQQSIHQLNSLGLQPDLIVVRAEKVVDKKRKEKVSLASGLSEDYIIASPDVNIVYEVPLILERQNVAEKILEKLKVKKRKENLKSWKRLIEKIKKVEASNKIVKIGIVGKYQTTGDYLPFDSYISVVEAIKHAAWHLGVRPKILWLDAESLEKGPQAKTRKELEKAQGIVVPRGWKKGGMEGRIRAVRFARENKIPFFGLCFGASVVEFARNVAGLAGANSTEVDSKTPHPVIHIMPGQKRYLKKHQYRGTIRLGHWPCRIQKRTHLHRAYGSAGIIKERHRHRYEFNNDYRKILISQGLIISGISPDGKLVEAIELASEDHPFFLATQFYPGYQSWLLNPHPLFSSFIKACFNS